MNGSRRDAVNNSVMPCKALKWLYFAFLWYVSTGIAIHAKTVLAAFKRLKEHTAIFNDPRRAALLSYNAPVTL